jgi:hypothetical protein
VKRRVGESGVELAIEAHVRHVEKLCINALLTRRRDHLRRIVDADHFGAAVDDLQRQRPFAAADIQDPLACPGVEQVERRCAKLADEAADLCVIGRNPAARRDRDGVQSVLTQSR